MNLRCLAFFAVLFAPLALAQTGPNAAHIVVAGMPDPGTLGTSSEPIKIRATISVGADGRPTDVQLEPSSGNPKLDERIRRVYLKMRVVPALTDAGIPTAGKVLVSVKLGPGMPASSFMTDPWSAESSGGVITSPAFSNEDLPGEVARIARMRCKDFLWEYDLMREIAGKQPIYDERMFKALLAMTLVYVKASGDQVDRVIKAFPKNVRTSSDQCRASPDTAFFKDSFAPVVQAALR